ncbi:MAG: hypothetical protein ACRDV9_12450 [Acidimicrobiia bacterium]
MSAQSAEDVRTWKTYKRADGDLIMGDYAFMTEPDCFENDDCGEYLEVVEETWSLVESRTLKYGRTDTWCEVCDEEFTLSEPAPPPHLCAAHIDGPDRG